MKVINFESLRAHFGKELKSCVVNSVSILSLTLLIPAGLSHGGDFGAGELEAGQGEAGGDAGFGADAGLGGEFGADQMGAAGGDAGFGAAGGFDAGAGAFGADPTAGGAEFPPEEALPEAFPAASFPSALPAQAIVVDATLKEDFDELEDALLLGDITALRKVCQSKQGGGCGAAKNFLSACTMFLREEDSFGGSACIKKGEQSYKMNPEGFVYPANPQKNKAEQSALDHLSGQMKESRKKLTHDKAKFLKIMCTFDSLSMLENKDDKRDMQEACLEFKYHGNPPSDALANLNKGAKVKKTPRPTIFADKESPEEDVVPVKKKKSAAHKKAKGNHKEKHEDSVKEEVAEIEKTDNAAAGVEAGAAAGAAAGAVAGAAAGAVAGAEVEPVQPVEVLPGQVIGAPQGNQADFGKALQAGQGLMGQYDTSGAGQQAMQGFDSFSSGLKGGAGGGGLGGFAGGAGLGGGEESSDSQ